MEELLAVSWYWSAEEKIGNSTEQCAYYRKHNKRFPTLLLMSILGTLCLQFISLTVAVIKLDFRYLRLILPVWLFIDSVHVISFLYSLRMKRISGGSDDARTSLGLQLRVQTRLNICRVSNTMMNVLIGVAVSYCKPNGFYIAWLTSFLLQIYACTMIIHVMLWKTLAIFFCNIAICYAGYVNVNLRDNIFNHIFMPTAISVLFFAVHGWNEVESFRLRRLLSSQKKVYESLLTKLQDPAVILECEGAAPLVRVMFINEAASRELGITQTNFFRRVESMVSLQGDSLDECIKAGLRPDLLAKSAQTADMVRQDKFFMHDEDRDLIQCDRVLIGTIITSTFSSHKKTISLVLHDITKELHCEEQRIEAHYKNMLLFSLSHELRTPLNIVQHAINIAKNYSLSNEDREGLSSAKGAWRYLRSKISDILDYSQLMTNEFALHLSTFLLEKFARSLEKTALYLIRQKSTASTTINFSMSVDPKLPTHIEADQERLEQILFNLLNNAVKYTETGSISLGISSSAGCPSTPIRYPVSTSTSSKKPRCENLVFTVTDTGCGMSEELIQSLFHQKSASIERYKHSVVPPLEGRRCGMGLSVSRVMCQKMGSDLHVWSTAGKGSVFQFSLPITVFLYKRVSDHQIFYKTEEGTADESEPRPQRLPQILVSRRCLFRTSSLMVPESRNRAEEPKTVLVVDDNVMNRLVVCGMMRKYAFDLIEAENGVVAVEKYKHVMSRRNVLILMDIDMPVMDGIEATREIRKLQCGPKPYICALTAFASEQMRRRAFEAGMDQFLSKPLTKSGLNEVLGKLEFIS
ncbi:MAG: response regulator [Candidatus Pacebacteria bacterium]|nr:response regulator [Candidatus Paceibacterota bacterium]